jgi:hypothetical protein
MIEHNMFKFLIIAKNIQKLPNLDVPPFHSSRDLPPLRCLLSADFFLNSPSRFATSQAKPFIRSPLLTPPIAQLPFPIPKKIKNRSPSTSGLGPSILSNPCETEMRIPMSKDSRSCSKEWGDGKPYILFHGAEVIVVRF